LWLFGKWWILKEPKFAFTLDDLTDCGIDLTDEWDGFGLLKATHIHQLPTEITIYIQLFSFNYSRNFTCCLYFNTFTKRAAIFTGK